MRSEASQRLPILSVTDINSESRSLFFPGVLGEDTRYHLAPHLHVRGAQPHQPAKFNRESGGRSGMNHPVEKVGQRKTNHDNTAGKTSI